MTQCTIKAELELNSSTQLIELVKWCNAHNIPTNWAPASSPAQQPPTPATNPAGRAAAPTRSAAPAAPQPAAEAPKTVTHVNEPITDGQRNAIINICKRNKWQPPTDLNAWQRGEASAWIDENGDPRYNKPTTTTAAYTTENGQVDEMPF